MEKIKDRIAKLLRLAMDQAEKPEGEAAARQAMKLMESYGIDEEDVKATREAQAIGRRDMDLPKAEWVYQVCFALKPLLGVWCAAGRGKASFYGREPDLDMAEYLASSLQAQCHRDCNNWRAKNPDAGRYECRTYRNSWVMGLREKIHSVVSAQRRAADEDCTALVPASRTDAAENYARRLNSFQSRNARLRTGSVAGHNAGRRANINPGMRGKKQAAIGH